MEHLIQHFRKDEQQFIEQVIGWQREVEDRYAPKTTDFLDPRQRFIVQAVIGQDADLLIQASGRFEQAERQRIVIAPNYYTVQEEDFQIVVFRVKYPSKFVQLKHPDVLGALLSLGLDRSKFGDIRIAEEMIQFAVAEEVATYVQTNLTSIGKAKVHVEEMMKELLLQMEEEWIESNTTVSSMRLDVVLAQVLNISRQKSQNLIASGRVKVNWTVREHSSFELQERDIVSARGFGRIKIIATEGRTKKDKIRLQVGKLEQKK